MKQGALGGQAVSPPPKTARPTASTSLAPLPSPPRGHTPSSPGSLLSHQDAQVRCSSPGCLRLLQLHPPQGSVPALPLQWYSRAQLPVAAWPGKTGRQAGQQQHRACSSRLSGKLWQGHTVTDGEQPMCAILVLVLASAAGCWHAGDCPEHGWPVWDSAVALLGGVHLSAGPACGWLGAPQAVRSCRAVVLGPGPWHPEPVTGHQSALLPAGSALLWLALTMWHPWLPTAGHPPLMQPSPGLAPFLFFFFFFF